MLQVEALSVRRGNVLALREVTITVQEGEVVSLVGSNGAGKSTLLYAIAGVLPVTSGRVVCQGRTLNGMAPEDVARMGVGLVPEGRQIFGTLSVLDNLLLGAYVHCVSRWGDLLGDVRRVLKQEDLRCRLEMVYGLFPVLEERQEQDGGSLSGGEQQMLAFGRALMGSPQLLLVDELSMGLAPALVTQLLALLGRLREMGITILLVEQNAYSALKVSDRGYILETGRIVAEGTAQDLLNSDQVRRAYLGRLPTT
jgi:branched-chain amino acid transport system ATP-binding protein